LQQIIVAVESRVESDSISCASAARPSHRSHGRGSSSIANRRSPHRRNRSGH